MLDVCIHTDGDVLVNAVNACPIAGIKPPIGHWLQVRVTLTDIKRVTRLGDIYQLADVR